MKKQKSGKEGWWRFLEGLAQVKNPKQLDLLFGVLMTYEEREVMATRILILDELLKGELTQRDMADQLGVSIAKITRGSNCIKELDDKSLALLTQFIEG